MMTLYAKIFFLIAFPTEKHGFELQQKPVPDLPTSTNLISLQCHITTKLTINCKFVFLIYSKNTDGRNAIKSFFGRS